MPLRQVTETIIEMGQNQALFSFDFNALGTADRFQVFYEGSTVFDSGVTTGFGSPIRSYGPGASTRLTIVVTSTGLPPTWEFEVSCPLDN